MQGVGYRYYTRHQANDLELQGWVSNRPDGSVEVHVQGSSKKLKIFEDLLRRGPDGGQVDGIERISSDSDDSFHEFEVRFG